ncbi:MAG: hypothetical protein P1U36_04100 [Legionellaceae bacterium]|nr:hypothetical protein [Legionellaceae bacterium]
MAINQSFFQSPQKKSVENITNSPSNIHIDNRADFAVAIWLIDYLRTTTHQKNTCIPSIILEPLLHKLQENAAYENTSVGYLTPIKYLKQLCLETDPNILVPALADVLNQLTLEYILNNPRGYTSYFLNITPHTLSQKNIERNTRCLNPLLPSIISRVFELPFYISTTSDKKTLPKKHPHSTPMLDSSTGIKLHWQNGYCLVSADIADISHFKSLDQTNIPPTTPLHLNNIHRHVNHLSQESTRSIEMYHTTKNKLAKYMTTEKKTYSDILKIYFEHLNRSIKQPSKYFDTLDGTQAFYQNTATHGITHGLKEAIARLLTLGEQLDLTTHPTEQSGSNYITPAA